MPWDPKQYEQFAAERYAPFEDLARLISVRLGLRVIDLGCGTGELTRRLAEMLPESDVLGIDSSGEMLEQARALEQPGLRFDQQAVEDVDGEWDLVFSHAALQWVENHASLIPRLFSLVAPGGQIAVQMPSNFSHPTHVFIDETADIEPFKEALGGGGLAWSRKPPVLSIESYADMLFAEGATDISVFEKVYPHILEDSNALLDWMAGTALVPYMAHLPAELHGPFVERYRSRLRERFPSKPVFFGFRRTIFVGTKP
jgi:trans-aconitate 2-methyltransferase